MPLAILFDLDGTLLDTSQDIANATNLVLTHHRYKPKSYDFIRSLISGGTKKIVADCFNIEGDHKKYKLFRQQIISTYQQQLATKTQLFPGMTEFLALLAQLSVPWGIVTNKPYWLANSLLQAMKLDKQCKCLIGSESLPMTKPHPQPLRYASQLIGVAEHYCAYIGDSITDIKAAQQANMYSVAAAYGYISQDQKVEDWQANHIVRTAYELSQWLRDRGIPLRNNRLNSPNLKKYC